MSKKENLTFKSVNWCEKDPIPTVNQSVVERLVEVFGPEVLNHKFAPTNENLVRQVEEIKTRPRKIENQNIISGLVFWIENEE